MAEEDGVDVDGLSKKVSSKIEKALNKEKGREGAERRAELHEEKNYDDRRIAVEEKKASEMHRIGDAITGMGRGMSSLSRPQKIDLKSGGTGGGKGKKQKKSAGISLGSHLKQHHNTYAEFFLFIILVGFHLFDATSGFSSWSQGFPRDRASVFGVLFTYLVLSLISAGILARSDGMAFGRKFLVCMGFGVIATFAPMLMGAMRQAVSSIDALCITNSFCLTTLIGIIITFFPIFPILVFMTSDSKVKDIIIWYILLWFIALTLLFARQAIADIPTNFGATMDTGEAIGAAQDTIFKQIIDGAKAAFGLKESMREQINRLYEPYFYGEVEENKDDRQLGVYLENLEPLVPMFLLDDDEIVVYADIKAKTFTGNLTLHNSCYAKYIGGDRKEHNVTGEVAPKTLDIADYEENTLVCTIPKTGINTTYANVEVWFISTFDFVTWGYVEYTFIERQELRNRQKSGIDNVARELGINEYLQPVYTNGPIMLGLVRRESPTRMPFAINQEDPTFPLFGVTLQNQLYYRERGGIKKIDELVFHVPDPIILEEDSCEPQGWDKHPNQPAEKDGYRLYTFKNIPVRKDAEYHTIRCRMHIDCRPGTDCASRVQEELLGVAGVSIATFAAEADYEYELAERTNVRLEVIPQGYTR